MERTHRQRPIVLPELPFGQFRPDDPARVVHQLSTPSCLAVAALSPFVTARDHAETGVHFRHCQCRAVTRTNEIVDKSWGFVDNRADNPGQAGDDAWTKPWFS